MYDKNDYWGNSREGGQEVDDDTSGKITSRNGHSSCLSECTAKARERVCWWSISANLYFKEGT